MAKSARAKSRVVHHRPLKQRLLLGGLYLLALFGLVLWEYREHLDFLSSGCDEISEASKPALYSAPYQHLLNWASSESASQVSIVAIPIGLEDIQGNLCQGRAYLADLLRSVAAEHPVEIVVDKFYGPSGCTSDPRADQELIAAVQSVPAPVVVGESTDKASSERDDACLVRRPQFDFASPNIHHGLTRLNEDTEKVPLQWRIFPNADVHAPAETADSLSWAAVKAYDAAYTQRPRLQALIDSHRHPYANLSIDLPRETSTDLLCESGTPAMRKRWSVSCSGSPKHLNLLGKIVVIGSEDNNDQRVVLGTRMWGFETQARYIEVLLSGSYLRALPFWAEFCTFAGFVFMIEGLPTLLEAIKPHWKRNKFFARVFHRRRYSWIILWTLCFLVTSTLVCLLLGYLPPLIVLGEICFVAITRLLFFAAESTETPFLHSKHEGA